MHIYLDQRIAEGKQRTEIPKWRVWMGVRGDGRKSHGLLTSQRKEYQKEDTMAGSNPICPLLSSSPFKNISHKHRARALRVPSPLVYIYIIWKRLGDHSLFGPSIVRSLTGSQLASWEAFDWRSNKVRRKSPFSDKKKKKQTKKKEKKDLFIPKGNGRTEGPKWVSIED